MPYNCSGQGKHAIAGGAVLHAQGVVDRVGKPFKKYGAGVVRNVNVKDVAQRVAGAVGYVDGAQLERRLTISQS